MHNLLPTSYDLTIGIFKRNGRSNSKQLAFNRACVQGGGPLEELGAGSIALTITIAKKYWAESGLGLLVEPAKKFSFQKLFLIFVLLQQSLQEMWNGSKS
ncbi:hypothetical protein QUA56_15035 [Microcoleus sp. N3A4]|uniref:hypothetical protein n=1 Tax=Microcoleus sp. N3A4 TaxID=3055379 RepID=UPI002FD060FA